MDPRLKSWAKGRLRTLFEVGQRAGVDILPRHFYSQIPDVAELRREHGWRRPYTMEAVAGTDLDRQLTFVQDCCPPELRRRISGGEVYRDACARNQAVGYGPVDSEFLYCFACTHRPAKVIQVGAGASTAILLQASEEAGFPIELICVDPYPTAFLEEQALHGAITLISQKVQDVDIDDLTSLGPGEMLFVDSTHTVSPGSDVNRIILEVLPRLGQGTWVHFHDILFPYDYSPWILEAELFFWSETVLLLSFLTGNARFAIRASLSMLHHGNPAALRELLPVYRPAAQVDGLMASASSHRGHHPSSIYLEVSKDG